MREIKFRAWDLVNKKMIRNPHIIFPDEDGFYLVENVLKRKIRSDLEIQLMQYTGLKDKNGKEEVYQDDLMKDLLHIYRVVWMECSARFLLIDVKEYMNQLSAEAIKLLPKIGNIYENPELMENENEIA